MAYELGILGAGMMAEVIARGVIAKGVFRPDQMAAADVSLQRRELFERELGVHATDDNLTIARQSKVLLLSVKPQQMAAALGGLGTAMDEQTLIVSIAAGVTSDAIERHLGGGRAWRVVRAMPNTPILVGEGMVGIAPGRHAQAADLETARRIFGASAAVAEVAPELMDAVTALSGSGPAYFFFLVEQMIAAGVQMGLDPSQADLLARRTALGAARMLTSGSESPQELRRRVTSPGGTTQAAIEHLESHDWPAITRDAIRAAERRGRELSGS